MYVCHTLEELIHHYDDSGLLTMIVQEFIEWDQFVRCMCLGQEEVLPMKYDPQERRYIAEHDYLSPELGSAIVEDALTLVRALGYDMNSVECAIRDGVPYAIDFMNPAPDMDVNSLTPHYFEWVVKHMADLAIRLALEPRPQAKEMRSQPLRRRRACRPAVRHARRGSAACRRASGVIATMADADRRLPRPADRRMSRRDSQARSSAAAAAGPACSATGRSAPCCGRGS